jgi:hypothetical protein
MLIIPKSGRHFKGDISTDKGGFPPYRTIVVQASQAQRVTKADFLEKKCQKNRKFRGFYYGKKRAVIETAMML